MATVFTNSGWYITGFNTIGAGSGTVPSGVAYIIFSTASGGLTPTMASYGSGTTYTVQSGGGFVIQVAQFPTQNL